MVLVVEGSLKLEADSPGAANPGNIQAERRYMASPAAVGARQLQDLATL